SPTSISALSNNLPDPDRPSLTRPCYPHRMSPTPISNRSAINRQNARHSTGPRTPAGKHRSSLNALRHGLTAASPVLPSENRDDFDLHRRRFFDEYQPATPTESQLVTELVDTSWRLNRIPLLEAQVLARAAAPIPPDAEVTFDIVDAHRLLAGLSLQSQRLSRQFQRALDLLREIQSDRAERERRSLKDAAALLELHKHEGIPFHPADHGFVFSNDEVERCATRLKLLNRARHIAHRPPTAAPDQAGHSAICRPEASPLCASL
ncbi:MAG TPA: hypothetical protein VFW44_16105, partial [Bryobacteraceae bacterium]|nr:hypothetical protein [Bryobacteraceae bacterium]